MIGYTCQYVKKMIEYTCQYVIAILYSFQCMNAKLYTKLSMYDSYSVHPSMNDTLVYPCHYMIDILVTNIEHTR